MKIITAAFEPELEPLRDSLGAREDIVLFECGVGCIEAAARLSAKLQELQEHENLEVIFIGSSGALNPALNILDLVSVSHVELVDDALHNDTAYRPDPFVYSYHASPRMSDALVSVARCTSQACTPLSITRSKDRARDIAAKTGADIENLELFGVATAALSHQVPWGALSAITNIAGPNAHSEWAANNRQAASITAEALQRYLDK